MSGNDLDKYGDGWPCWCLEHEWVAKCSPFVWSLWRSRLGANDDGCLEKPDAEMGTDEGDRLKAVTEEDSLAGRSYPNMNRNQFHYIRCSWLCNEILLIEADSTSTTCC